MLDYRPQQIQELMLGAGVRYRVALNLNNVFNKKYYTSQFRGSEREVMLNMNLYW